MPDLSFAYDKKTILDLCDARIARGDFLGALNTLKRMNEPEKRLLYKVGDLYYKLTEYGQAAEYFARFLEKASEKEKPRAYNALGAAFLKMNDEEAASYYFNKQIASGDRNPYDYGEEMYDFFTDVSDAEGEFYLAYPYDKADFKKLLIECDDMFAQGLYEEVLEKIKVIPKENKRYYPEALEERALCEFMLGDDAAAIKHIRAALKLAPNDVTVICNAASMFNRVDMLSEANAALKNVDVNALEGDELFKIVMVNCDLKNYGTAASLVKKYLKTAPYDRSALMLAGIANYNLKNYAAAYEYFKTLYQLTGTYVAGYYLKIADFAVRGKPVVKTLEFGFDVPAAEKARVTKKLKRYMGTADEELSEKDFGELILLSEYAFESKDYNLQSCAVAALAAKNSDFARGYLLGKLVKLSVFGQIKTAILGFLTADGFEGDAPAFFGSTYRTIKFVKTEFKGANAEVFSEAYSLCFAKVAPMEDDVSYLRTAAYELFDEAKHAALDRNDARALSAVIFEKSKVKQIKSRRDFAKFFMTTLKDIKRVKEVIAGETAPPSSNKEVEKQAKEIDEIKKPE